MRVHRSGLSGRGLTLFGSPPIVRMQGYSTGEEQPGSQPATGPGKTVGGTAMHWKFQPSKPTRNHAEGDDRGEVGTADRRQVGRWGLLNDGRGEETNEVIGRAVAGGEEIRLRASCTTGGREDSWRVARTPHAGNGLSGNDSRSGISHGAERGTNRHRDPSPMEMDGSHAHTLPSGTGPGSRQAARPAGDRGRGRGRRLTQAFLGRDPGDEVGPRENERASG